MNKHGVDENALVISLPQQIIHADRFIEAIRHVKKKAPMVETGIIDFSPSDLFVLQIAKVLQEHGKGTEGTHATLPDDVLNVIYT